MKLSIDFLIDAHGYLRHTVLLDSEFSREYSTSDYVQQPLSEYYRQKHFRVNIQIPDKLINETVVRRLNEDYSNRYFEHHINLVNHPNANLEDFFCCSSYIAYVLGFKEHQKYSCKLLYKTLRSVLPFHQRVVVTFKYYLTKYQTLLIPKGLLNEIISSVC